MYKQMTERQTLLQNLVPNTKVNALFRSSMYKENYISFVCTILSLCVYHLSFCHLSVHFYHLVFIVCLSVICLYISITLCLSSVFLSFVCTFLSLCVYHLSFCHLSVHVQTNDRKTDDKHKVIELYRQMIYNFLCTLNF
jgi:hypothetical protein